MNNKFPVIFLLVLFFNSLSTNAQDCASKLASFKKLSKPEKYWVISHIFVASKALKISNFVRMVTDSLKINSILDGDSDGGQIDAFRHSYWMALLVKEMNFKKALKLGKAHEKGNYLDFKEGKKEEGNLPDKIACEMDIWNNEVGISLGKKYLNISPDSLKTIIINEILNGSMKVIYKNKTGDSLDKDGNLIPLAVWSGKWENQRFLIESSYNSQKNIKKVKDTESIDKF